MNASASITKMRWFPFVLGLGLFAAVILLVEIFIRLGLINRFIVPMPWGESTDWYRNVRAAGECTIRWKGRDYSLVDPEVTGDLATAAPGFSALQRAMMTRLGIRQALRLHRRS